MSSQPAHLIVLSHGLNGSSANMDFLQTVLQSHLDQTHPGRFLVLNSEANSGFEFRLPPFWSWFIYPNFLQHKTNQGIDIGGERLAQDIEQKLKAIPSLTRVSFIGHSLGGIYARYAAGVLHRNGWFDYPNSTATSSSSTSVSKQKIATRRIEPVNFITLASPHLGSLQIGKGIPAFKLLTSGVQLTVSQLLLRDQPFVQSTLPTSSSIPITSSSSSLSSTSTSTEKEEHRASSQVERPLVEAVSNTVQSVVETSAATLNNGGNASVDSNEVIITQFASASASKTQSAVTSSSVHVSVAEELGASRPTSSSTKTPSAFSLTMSAIGLMPPSPRTAKILVSSSPSSFSSSLSSQPLPMMLQLCCSPFIDVLALFCRRTLYANALHDRTVSFCTAALCVRNPIRDCPDNILTQFELPGFPALIEVNSLLQYLNAKKTKNGGSSQLPTSSSESLPVMPSSSTSSGSSASSASVAVPPAPSSSSSTISDSSNLGLVGELDASVANPDDVDDGASLWPPSFNTTPLLRAMFERLVGSPDPSVMNGYSVRVNNQQSRLTSASSEESNTSSSASSPSSSASIQSTSKNSSSTVAWRRIAVRDRAFFAHVDISVANSVISADSSGGEVVRHVCNTIALDELIDMRELV